MAQVQALLGIGGAHFAARRYHEAEQAYAEVVDVAEGQEGLFSIVVEAHRMRGACLEQLGDPAEARGRYEAALSSAEAMQPQAARMTAFALAGERLASLLEASSDVKAAADTRARVDALANRPDVPVAQHGEAHS